MKKLLLFILLLLPFCLKAQQTHPVAPQQMNQNTSYNEPSTGDWWIYRGATYGWFHVNKSLPVPNTVLTGLGMSVSNDTLTVATGTWRIGNAVFSLSSPVQFVLSARDSIYSRYETVYADSVNNGIHIAVGALSPTPVEPSIPTGDLRVGAVLITPTGTSILPPTPTTDYVFSQPTVLQSYANPWVRTIRADTGKFSGYILPTHDGLSGQSPQTDGAGNLFFATPNVNGVGYGLLLNANNAILDTTKVITPWKLDSTLLANTAIFNPTQFSISHDTVNLISYLTSDTSTNNTTNYFSTKAVKQLIANGAGGGITSIGVTTANGISGTSSGGTTPSLTLALGNITPTSISTIVKPATVFQTGVGTFGTDSILVVSGGVLKRVLGSSASYTASGGVVKSGNDFRLGNGTFTNDVTIHTSTYKLQFDGTDGTNTWTLKGFTEGGGDLQLSWVGTTTSTLMSTKSGTINIQNLSTGKINGISVNNTTLTSAITNKGWSYVSNYDGFFDNGKIIVDKRYTDSTSKAKADSIKATISYNTLGAVPTSRTVAGFALSSNVSLAALTATDGSLTFSGSYDGSTAQTVGLNPANSNSFSVSQRITSSTTGTSFKGDGLVLENIGAASSGVPSNYSNLLRLAAQEWNSTSSVVNYSDFAIQNVTIGGAFPYSTLTFLNYTGASSTPGTYTTIAGLDRYGVFNAAAVRGNAVTYANRPSATTGNLFTITDATTSTIGASVTAGGGSNIVLVWYNGTNLIVVAH